MSQQSSHAKDFEEQSHTQNQSHTQEFKGNIILDEVERNTLAIAFFPFNTLKNIDAFAPKFEIKNFLKSSVSKLLFEKALKQSTDERAHEVAFIRLRGLPFPKEVKVKSEVIKFVTRNNYYKYNDNKYIAVFKAARAALTSEINSKLSDIIDQFQRNFENIEREIRYEDIKNDIPLVRNIQLDLILGNLSHASATGDVETARRAFEKFYEAVRDFIGLGDSNGEGDFIAKIPFIWHVNFADRQVFGWFDKKDISLASEDVRAFEHPIVGYIREFLKKISDYKPGDKKKPWVDMFKDAKVNNDFPRFLPELSNENYESPHHKQFNPVTSDGANRPTPILFIGVPRQARLDIDGIYGKILNNLEEKLVLDKLHPTDLYYTNFISMEALDHKAAPTIRKGNYDVNQLRSLLRTALTGFAGARAAIKPEDNRWKPIIINTGLWGCGTYKNNPGIIALIQYAAAHLVGLVENDWAISRIVFHHETETSYSKISEDKWEDKFEDDKSFGKEAFGWFNNEIPKNEWFEELRLEWTREPRIEDGEIVVLNDERALKEWGKKRLSDMKKNITSYQIKVGRDIFKRCWTKCEKTGIVDVTSFLDEVSRELEDYSVNKHPYLLQWTTDDIDSKWKKLCDKYVEEVGKRRKRVMNDEEIQILYSWIEEIPLSRAKKNITRDFSDGVAVAEIVRYLIPKLVEMHNYSPANAIAQKMYNWNTLRERVFKKLGFNVDDELIRSIVQTKPGYIEILLNELRKHIDSYLSLKSSKGHKKHGSFESSSSSPMTMHFTPSELFQPYESENTQNHCQTSTSQNFNRLADKSLSVKENNTLRNSTTSVPNGGAVVGPEFLIAVQEKDKMIVELQETIQILLLKIMATNSLSGIGLEGTLPWTLPADLKFFASVTSRFSEATSSPKVFATTAPGLSQVSLPHTSPCNVVIMGRKTWLSIPAKFRPLKNRLNVVLSRNSLSVSETTLCFSSLDAALLKLDTMDIADIFIIGGASLYNEAIFHPRCTRIFLTQILSATSECDTFFPRREDWGPGWNKLTLDQIKERLGGNAPTDIMSENELQFQFEIYEKII
ncbi:Sperm flagellar protein 1 [Nowakowskiella sp. JEL0078]|nr:Sperm flagellar protein 1 [Nowakowskiella sp. JEL0078]